MSLPSLVVPSQCSAEGGSSAGLSVLRGSCENIGAMIANSTIARTSVAPTTNFADEVGSTRRLRDRCVASEMVLAGWVMG